MGNLKLKLGVLRLDYPLSSPSNERLFTTGDGKWGTWFENGDCSQTCGSGVMQMRRRCTVPSPAFGGTTCPEDENLKQVVCNTNPCRKY